MLCAGQVELLNTFFDAVQTRPPQGISIEQFIKTEIPIPEDFDLNLPNKFLKLATDELADIGRKLDTGVELLKTLPQIEESVSTLPEIKTGIDMLNLNFDDFRTDQREHNRRMEEHNKRIEEQNKQLTQIMQKLAEK